VPLTRRKQFRAAAGVQRGWIELQLPWLPWPAAVNLATQTQTHPLSNTQCPLSNGRRGSADVQRLHCCTLIHFAAKEINEEPTGHARGGIAESGAGRRS